MTKTAKGLLAGAIVCLLAGGVVNLGWINPGNVDALYVLLPLGAVFLGLFLIVLVLGKESGVYERELHSAEGGKDGAEKAVGAGPGGHGEKVAEQNFDP